MEVLSYVKDLLLYYANKKAELKTNSESKDKYEALDKELVSNMLVLRDRFPEYLFVNYDKNITEEEAKEVFKRIKANVSNRYSIPYLPKPQFMPIDIDGTKMEIPCGIAGNQNNGVFYVSYKSREEKRNCINQFLIHLLVTLPIKKISLTFIDLKGDYDSELLLHNLPSTIYNNPITTEEDVEKLLDRLHKRKEEYLVKYRDFSSYCEENKEIPTPYEVIVFYDDLSKEIESIRKEKSEILEFYDTKVLKKLRELLPYSLKTGVFYLFSYIQNGNNISCDLDYQSYYLNDFLFDEDKSELSVESHEAIKFDKIDFGYTGLFHARIDNSFSPCYFQGITVGKGTGEYVIRDEHQVKYSCSSLKECYSYYKSYSPSIELDVVFTGNGLWNPKCTLELLVDEFDVDVILKYYYDDLKYYLSQLGLQKELIDRMFGILKGKISPNQEQEEFGYYSGNDKGFTFRYWKESSSEKMYALRDNLIADIRKNAEIMWGKQNLPLHLTISSDKHNHKRCYEFVVKREYIGIPVERYIQPQYGGLINYTPVTNNETLLKACFDYIRTEAEAKEEMKVQNLDFESAAESKYETDLSTMIIPVGKAETKDADFRMDLVSHVHSFIIGQSGSGKSVFLHNIIGGAMLKYAPEDLQLYLLDFKLGGVEFNRYQGAKHVKALLVDNSDPQVTLEILRELRNSMTERGKLLRSAGVNNIGEYNKLHQEDRMPHVLVVADECHEMFKADDSIPRQVRNEISDIVIKIAKEGRSQGVHLVFATQTLSGTEISSEIINNVSDFYLLKCAQTDSERLVPNSSAITSELSTGQIYYHHVDEQVKFQAYYTDKEAAEKLMAAIVEKAKDHKSNGEFYFNGAQMFYLDDSVKERMLAVKGKSPLAFMGKAIDISQKDLYIKLNEDFSENVLLLGLNDQEQVTRTTMNLFVSLMMSAKLKHKDIAFKVIDCLNNEEGEVHELIFDLENEGHCEIIERRQRSKFFKELAQGVQNGTAEETILLILGQDRFRELKMDMELEESNSSKSSDDDDMMSISDDFFGDSSSSSTNIRTYRDALNVILEKGPDYGVHTLLQIEKASNLLFEDYITPKMVLV